MMADFLANLFARLTTGGPVPYTIVFIFEEPEYPED